MVMVIARLLLGMNHRLRCGQAVEGTLTEIEDDFVSGLSAQQTFANLVFICVTLGFDRGRRTCRSLINSG
jgi:hypothetical protein